MTGFENVKVMVVIPGALYVGFNAVGQFALTPGRTLLRQPAVRPSAEVTLLGV